MNYKLEDLSIRSGFLFYLNEKIIEITLLSFLLDNAEYLNNLKSKEQIDYAEKQKNLQNVREFAKSHGITLGDCYFL